jgi:uncharacterized protein
MTTLPRRSFLLGAGGGAAGVLAFSGSLARVLGTPAGAATRARIPGYGPLVPDPAGVLDLPAGFRYVAFSRVGTDTLDDGTPVPGSHDGMAAFEGARGRTLLVRNHEISPEDVEEDGAAPVPHVDGHTYDPQGTGGTTTLVVDRARRLESHAVSLAGTSSNCAGGPTPWDTWLTCEETDEVIDGVRHGYVFEVDPVAGGDPHPRTALGRFEHEAVSFDNAGIVYLTEDADTPFGQIYRFLPDRSGPGGLRDGGRLETLRIPDLAGTDLSAVTEAGTVFTGLEWLPVATPDVPESEKLRELFPGPSPRPRARGSAVGSSGSCPRTPSAPTPRTRRTAAPGCTAARSGATTLAGTGWSWWSDSSRPTTSRARTTSRSPRSGTRSCAPTARTTASSWPGSRPTAKRSPWPRTA